MFGIGVLLLTLLWLGSLNGKAAQVSIVRMGIIDLIFLAILVSWCHLVDKLRIAEGQANEPPLASQAHRAG